MNRSKFTIILATILFAGCAFEGQEFADDSADASTTDDALIFGANGTPVPDRGTVKPGDTIVTRTRTCVRTEAGLASVNECIAPLSVACTESGGFGALDLGRLRSYTPCEDNPRQSCSLTVTHYCRIPAGSGS